MNCQQKSGVFLNIDCTNTIQNTCSNCQKEVCDIHGHTWETTMFCEDCYWEHFLLALENKLRMANSTHDDVIILGSSVSSHSNSDTSETPEGFDGGFGGGEFSGGGAGASWTEGDMESLTDTNDSVGLFSDDDNTFFYS